MIPGAFLTTGTLLLLYDLSFFRAPRHRGKKGRHELPCRRAGATPRTFWAAESRKSGFAPARFDFFFHGDFPFPRCRIAPVSKDFGSRAGEEVSIPKVQSVILTFFTRYSLNPRQAQSAAAETCQSGRCASRHSFLPPGERRFH